MVDLTDPRQIGELKKAFEYSFRGPQGEKTMEFLEQFCGFYLGGPRDEMTRLQYEAGKRDVILTIKTIGSEKWSPDQVASHYKRMDNG